MNENRFELGFEQVKEKALEMEQIRKEYYLEMMSAPTSAIKRELELLTDEINGLETEKGEIERELLDLSSFKLLLTSVIDKRGDFDDVNDDGWNAVYNGNQNKPSRPTRKVDCRRIVEGYNAFDEKDGE